MNGMLRTNLSVMPQITILGYIFQNNFPVLLLNNVNLITQVHQNQNIYPNQFLLFLIGNCITWKQQLITEKEAGMGQNHILGVESRVISRNKSSPWTTTKTLESFSCPTSWNRLPFSPHACGCRRSERQLPDQPHFSEQHKGDRKKSTQAST